MTSDNSLEIWVKVNAGASRDRIDGWMEDQLKLRVAAAPERGRANRAVCALIARTLDVAPRDVTVVQGPTSPRKRIRIAGDPVTLWTRLTALYPGSDLPAPR
ncbi:DUF167 domain-containing protein [uncultured Abyssibacter sp.]|uniref:DUF167 domain-containing protein n=1 Tax=uncultured Abyssibacter sp. TaxID=2320202 RepID=UPI0032B2CAF7|tara:strand:+ start:284 stop:589 length:306 start_codon:yes stop_codon:yes gene_type:complete